MVAALTHVVLPALFLGSGLFALATLVLTWRHYLPQARALREQLARLDGVENFAVRIARIDVREGAAPVRRKRAAVRQMERPAQRMQPARRAAA